MPLRAKRSPVAAALLIAAGLIPLAGCKDAPAPEEPVIRPVRAIEVADATGSAESRTFSAVSRASDESRLSFRVGGSLRSLTVKLGDKVQQGQVIATVDPSDLQLQAQQAADAYSQARASERRAKAEFERTRTLYENNGASRSQFDQAQAGYEQARASLGSAGRQLQLARKQVGYATLKAPTDGVVSAVLAQINENVGAGQAVVKLASGGAPEVLINVSGTFVGRVEVGDTIQVKFADIPDTSYGATVREVGVTPGEQQTTFPVIATIADPDEKIRLGMAADATFTAERNPDEVGLFVPATAVGEDRNGRYVFKVEPAGEGLGTVKRHAVQVDPALGGRGIRVTEGVAAGDRVVTAGVSRIVDGQTVRLQAPQGAAE